ncbi:hypothetical protein C0991_006208 [Blastosporella zonata]|nr:hypothetical protein C0991_006208 [Blastosporella zonata]
MADFTVVDPRGWEYDLHSVYSAYIGYFQLHNIPWYDRSWGHLFSTFEEFLAFSWPTITVTDSWTGKPHIVTRLTSIGAFLKMIKTRFGETLPQAPNVLQVTPFEFGNRHLRHISDYASYKKLYSTLPAVVLSALKARIKAGEPKAIQDLWEKRDKTFLAIDFEWSERNEKSCLEWGYAAVRCGHLEALGHWPPNPATNYRSGHVIISEYVDKVFNKHCPTHPWQYAFGDSQIAPKSKLPDIIQAVIRLVDHFDVEPFVPLKCFTSSSSLASPDSETTANTLVLVAHGISGDLSRLEEMKIKLPHNMLIVDTATFERVLHSSGLRGIMIDPRTNAPRVPGSTLSLENLLRSFTTHPIPASPTGSVPPVVSPVVLPNVMMHNAGNDALMALFALQMLLDPTGTQAPAVKRGRIGRPGGTPPGGVSPITLPLSRPRSMALGSPMMEHSPPFVRTVTMPMMATPTGSYDLAEEFGNMKFGGKEKEMHTGAWGRRMPGRANGNAVTVGRR